ncbi:MAG: hypothetical protein KDK07_02380 [Bauldia sp.]|nr:hypothetical protein [Bauldia sp.]
MNEKPRLAIACFTSFNAAYANRARILQRTLADAHPDWTFVAVVVEERSAAMERVLADFPTKIWYEDLPCGREKRWIFKHNVVEACTAVKGDALCALLQRGFDAVVYLDPDIAIFHPLHSIGEELLSSSILLTPHQIHPNKTWDAIKDNELTSLMYGVYNLGFVGVRNDITGQAFASWWSQQLYQACYEEVDKGIFTDQKWCDLVPSLFDRVRVLRDPGLNVASWNLSGRVICFAEDGGILVNGSPLKFYHFTKINKEGDAMTDRYAGGRMAVFEIWEWYRSTLSVENQKRPSQPEWSLGKFGNGHPIPFSARKLFRERRDLYEQFLDPFNVGPNSFWDWLTEHEPQICRPRGGATA